MKIKGSNFYLDLVTLFRGLTHLNSRISTKKFKISNNTQRFLQHSSSESLIYRPLHHTMKIKVFNFFLGFRHSFRGLTPLKFNNFDQKFKISNNNQNFTQQSP